MSANDLEEAGPTCTLVSYSLEDGGRAFEEVVILCGPYFRFATIQRILSFSRCAGVSGWLHEHCSRANGGICKWATEKQIWRRVHSRQQRLVHKHAEETSLMFCEC